MVSLRELSFSHKLVVFVVTNLEAGWIEVQERTGVADLAQATSMTVAQCLAAEFSGCCHIDDIRTKSIL